MTMWGYGIVRGAVRGGVAVIVAVIGLGVGAFGAPAAAQNGAPERVRVFLDCQTRGCAQQEFRTEITFVDWVRERTVADVHVILTSQNAGAGQQYVFDFIGQGGFDGADLRLEETTSDTDTRDEVLNDLVRTFKGGLVPYVARRGYLDELSITALERATEAADAEIQVAADDPWNLWVFSVGMDLEANGEEQQSSYELGGRLNASRVTPEWKINLGLDVTHEYERYTLSSGEQTYDTDEWDVDALIVRSLTSHWSAGTLLGASRSTSLNREIGGRGALALEWNLFPYAEANRRQLIFHYQLGFSRIDYEETTLYGKSVESLFDHRLVAVYDTRQPWGNVSFSARWSNYLHDFDRFSVGTRARANFRLFRGFDLRIEGNYEVIRDQLYVVAPEDISDEEILIQRRELETGYEYGVEIGFSYRFGSIYNNVVNNRFPWDVLF